jgi:hypothetical protein
MSEAFLGGVPTGTDAQPTGETFHLKILGRPYTRGVSAAPPPSIENHEILRTDHCRQGGRSPVPGVAFQGRKFSRRGVAPGGTAASGCCMVDTGAGPKLRLRPGQGQVKGRPALDGAVEAALVWTA